MNKYIDAERLKAEIERRLERYDPDYTNAGSELKELLSFIASLQQEQPEIDLDKEIQSFWNANALEYRLGHVADINFLAYTARHFAEWGATHINARKEE